MDIRSRLRNQLSRLGNSELQPGTNDLEEIKAASGMEGGIHNNARAIPPEEADTAAKEEERFLTAHEMKYRGIILKEVLAKLDLSKLSELDPEQSRRQIRTVVLAMMAEENYPLNEISRVKVAQIIEDEILGLGPLEILLQDPAISDIMVNGSHCVYVEKAGRLRRTPVAFEDDTHLMRIIDRIVSRVGRRVDESVPMVDARLPDGSRVNVIIPPLALDGPVVSIRRFPADPLTLPELVKYNTVSPLMMRFLMAAVKSRRNFVISGGTGSGKTTMLNALSAYIPASERIVTIEDAAELQLQQPHVVRLETRPPNIEGKGTVTARDLVRNALRMRPDRIVVGEVRGEEAIDMLQAMNTGHDGSLTTVHANSSRDALSRIENMLAMSGYELPVHAVRAQIASAIDLIIQVQRLEDGSRRMIAISEIAGMEGNVITMADIFVFQRLGVDKKGVIQGEFRSTGVAPTFLDDLRRKGIDLPPSIFDPDADHRHSLS